MPQTSSSRWLLLIGLVVGALIVLSVVVTLVRSSAEAELLPADTAEGTVQRYIRAYQEGDYAAAYALLSPELQGRCSLSEFERFSGRGEIEDSRVQLGESRDLSTGREVKVKITNFYGAPPFGGESTWDARYVLSQFDGQWRLTQADWPYGGCPFFEPEKPAPAATPTPTPTPSGTPAGAAVSV